MTLMCLEDGNYYIDLVKLKLWTFLLRFNCKVNVIRTAWTFILLVLLRYTLRHKLRWACAYQLKPISNYGEKLRMIK